MKLASTTQLNILVVEDEVVNSTLLQAALSKSPLSISEVKSAESLSASFELLDENKFDVVLLDLNLPDSKGLDTLARVSQRYPRLAIVVITGEYGEDLGLEAVAGGAQEYLIKGKYDLHSLSKSIHYAIQRKQSEESLRRAYEELEDTNKELKETQEVTLFALAKLAESRDPETGQHIERMRAYCQLLAEQLGREGAYENDIDDRFVEDLYRSSPLHDIGKVGIPDTILLKPGRLTTEEFEIMKRHALIGARTLDMAARHSKSGGFLSMAVDVARSHHERFDGTGYPDGISGQSIPLAARILGLVDVFDAITSARVYKSAFEPGVGKSMIEQEKGGHFDPVVVEAFCTRWADFVEIRGLVDHSERELVETCT